MNVVIAALSSNEAASIDRKFGTVACLYIWLKIIIAAVVYRWTKLTQAIVTRTLFVCSDFSNVLITMLFSC